MTQTINTVKSATTIISKIAAGMLADELQFLKTVDKEPEESFSQVNGYNPGDTINISKPARFTMGTTADITGTVQDVIEQKVPLALDKQRNVAVNLTSAEIATDLSLKSWANRILKPAVSELAQGIEAECLGFAKNAVYQSVGTAGSTVFDTNTMLSARTQLKQSLVPGTELFALLNSSATQSASNARKGLFNNQAELAKTYKSGTIGAADGFTYLENNMLPLQTNGNDIVFEVRTTVSVQGTTSLVVEALTTTTGTVNAGTVFTVAGVYSVHPILKVSTGQLQQFVSTTSVTADASGYATLVVSPAMYTTGSQQNIVSFPQDGDAITPVGGVSTSYTQNFAYAASAFRFASVPLVLPDGTDMASQSTVDGITVRVIRDYLPLTDKMVMRLDVLYGFTTVRGEWACRITA